MVQQEDEKSLTMASLLSALTLTDQLGTITDISFASRRDGLAGPCRTHAILTLDSRSINSWELARERIANANLHIDREGSSALCLSMMELETLLFQYVRLEPRYGFVRLDRIYDLITSIRIPGIGSGATVYSTMQCSGGSTNIEYWLEPWGLSALLEYWKICLRLRIRPCPSALDRISEINPTIRESWMFRTDVVLAGRSRVELGYEISETLRKLYSATSQNGRASEED